MRGCLAKLFGKTTNLLVFVRNNNVFITLLHGGNYLGYFAFYHIRLMKTCVLYICQSVFLLLSPFLAPKIVLQSFEKTRSPIQSIPHAYPEPNDSDWSKMLCAPTQCGFEIFRSDADAI